MTRQINFLDTHDSAPDFPEGLRYQPELITPADEDALLAHLRQLPFKEFEFHGYKGKRRVVSFGWQYEFSGRGTLRKAEDIPQYLLPVRERAASFAGLEPSALQHVLVIEYAPGAGIGWHRDRPVFGQVVGVSLLAPCILRFRRKVTAERDEERVSRTQVKGKSGTSVRNKRSPLPPGEGSGVRVRSMWKRLNILAQPRSAYHLSGPARSEWQHSILRVDELRYSITFRSMSEARP